MTYVVVFVTVVTCSGKSGLGVLTYRILSDFFDIDLIHPIRITNYIHKQSEFYFLIRRIDSTKT